MKIKKIDCEVTYLQKTETLTLDVNGRTIRLYAWQVDDQLTSNYENNLEIDQSDIKLLTEEEEEMINDEGYALFDLKDGEVLEVEDNG